MWHTWERREKCARFWWESPKERDHLGRLRYRSVDGIRMDLRETAGDVQIEFDWLRIGTSGELL
jgi:hypothetical protein